MILLMGVILPIRTGWHTPLSTPWFPRLSATELAQHHPPPEIVRELAHFLRQRHWLIEIGQELTQGTSASHFFCAPPHVFSIILPR
jgi:hypothetical protein